MHKIIIVTGSRAWDKPEYIKNTLTWEDPDLVVQGGANGVDTFASEWCDENNCEGVTIKAKWDKLGKRAGILRNIEMLEAYPNAEVHAFLMNRSRGTMHCIFAAKDRLMKVTIHHYENA